MKRSPLPQRTTGIKRAVPLKRSGSLRPVPDSGRPWFPVVLNGGLSAAPVRSRTSRPKDTIPPGVRRLVAGRDYGLCVHCSQPAEHQHHRRIKGMGGSTAPHADCCCVIISVCAPCHEWLHANRREAEAEGLIIPRATPKPWLLPVMLHGPGGGITAQPACDGRWLTFEPDSGGAA
jgi:hypothetical protein